MASGEDNWPWQRLLWHAAKDDSATALIGPSGALTRGDLVHLVQSHAEVASPRRGTAAEAVIGQLARQHRGERDLEVSTSGSTATPRLLRRSVDSWAASLRTVAELTEVQAHDVLWAPGGAASTLAQYAIWLGLWAGVPVVAQGPWPLPQARQQHRSLTPESENGARLGVSVVHTVPTVLNRILVEREAGSLPSLRLAVVAGETLSASLRDRAADADLRLIEYYGAAELSFVAIDPDGSGLRPFPGVEVAAGDSGRLRVRSPYLAHNVADANGWAQTPDRAELTDFPDGVRLRILGRDDAAIVGGTTVILAEVETRLAQLGELSEVVVVADPHPFLGQRVGVVARVADGVEIDQARLAIAAAADEMSAAARPGRVNLSTAPLPRTGAGKLDRAAASGRRG